MEIGMRVIKYMLFIFNLFFAVSGIALIVTGAVVQGFYSQYLDFIGNESLSATVLFIVIGVVIFFVAFFGCCGAIRESPCMIITFALLLSFIFTCEIAGGIAAYVLRSNVRLILQSNNMLMRNYNRSGHGGVTKAWDILQHNLHCCGVNNYTDWLATPFANKTLRVPDTCCMKSALVDEDCGANFVVGGNETTIYVKGCMDGIAELIQQHAGAFAGVGIGIAIIQSIGIIFACLLARSLRRLSPTMEDFK